MAYNTLLSNLQLKDDKQSVRVKLICKGRIQTGPWYLKTPMVFGDQKGSTIQATLYEDLHEPTDISLDEGNCYEISKFKVTHGDGLIRLSKNRYHINLNNTSLITKITAISDVSYYDFASYKLTRHGLMLPKYSIDLYGALVGVGAIEYFVHEVNAEMQLMVNRRIQFSLINMQFTQIRCLAYGNVAQQLHDFWIANKADVVLCVLQFWKIDWGEGGFNNVTTIEGFSKILFDPEEVQEVKDFRKRIPNTAF